MKAIILAAGRGSRMGNFTANKPKCFVRWGNKTLFEWQVRAFRGAGIQDIAVITGYKSRAFDRFNVVNFHNAEWATTNMVYSLSHANSWLKAHDCLVSYSDIVFGSRIVRDLQANESDIAIAYDPNWYGQWNERFSDVTSDAETFRIDEAGNIFEIGRKASSPSEIQGQYMGLFRLTPVGWAHLSKVWRETDSDVQNTMHMTHLLSLAITQDNFSVVGVPNHQFWHEVDSQNDYHLLMTKSPHLLD